MSNLITGVKSKLIGELTITTYIIGSALVKKYIQKGSSTGLMPLIIWGFIWGFYSYYVDKKKDIDDELSKYILSKVNGIANKLMIFFLGIIGLFFSTPYTQNITLANQDIGLIFLSFLFIQSLLKLGLFIFFDRKGISE